MLTITQTTRARVEPGIGELNALGRPTMVRQKSCHTGISTEDIVVLKANIGTCNFHLIWNQLVANKAIESLAKLNQVTIEENQDTYQRNLDLFNRYTNREIGDRELMNRLHTP